MMLTRAQNQFYLKAPSSNHEILKVKFLLIFPSYEKIVSKFKKCVLNKCVLNK